MARRRIAPGSPVPFRARAEILAWRSPPLAPPFSGVVPGANRVAVGAGRPSGILGTVRHPITVWSGRAALSLAAAIAVVLATPSLRAQERDPAGDAPPGQPEVGEPTPEAPTTRSLGPGVLRVVVLPPLEVAAMPLGGQITPELRVTRVARNADGEIADVAEPAPLLSGDASAPFVLLFWSGRCPVSRRYREATEALIRDYGGRVRFAFVLNGDEPGRDLFDMLDAAELTVPALRDGEHALANQLGVWVTPSALVFDAQGSLRYRGPIDDDRAAKDREAAPYLRDALQAVLAGRDVESAEPRAFGSAIRRPGIR